jgi:hypothetical protein
MRARAAAALHLSSAALHLSSAASSSSSKACVNPARSGGKLNLDCLSKLMLLLLMPW